MGHAFRASSAHKQPIAMLTAVVRRSAGGASSVAARPVRRTARGKHGRAASESADEERMPSPTLRKKRSRWVHSSAWTVDLCSWRAYAG